MMRRLNDGDAVVETLTGRVGIIVDASMYGYVVLPCECCTETDWDAPKVDVQFEDGRTEYFRDEDDFEPA